MSKWIKESEIRNAFWIFYDEEQVEWDMKMMRYICRQVMRYYFNEWMGLLRIFFSSSSFNVKRGESGWEGYLREPCEMKMSTKKQGSCLSLTLAIRLKIIEKNINFCNVQPISIFLYFREKNLHACLNVHAVRCSERKYYL